MFRIDWLESPLNELTAIWTRGDSASRQAITAAAQLMEQELQNQPQLKGESRDDGKRILFVPPLGFHFRIDSPQHLVTILHVWSFHKRGQ